MVITLLLTLIHKVIKYKLTPFIVNLGMQQYISLFYVLFICYYITFKININTKINAKKTI